MHAQTNEVTDDHHSIELNFLRITAKPEDLATISAMMEKMGWMRSENPILVNRRIPPSTQTIPTQIQVGASASTEPHLPVQGAAHPDTPVTPTTPTPSELPVVASRAEAITLEPAALPTSSTGALEDTPTDVPALAVAPNPPPSPPVPAKPFCVLAKRHVENMRRAPGKKKKNSAKDAYRALTLFLHVMGDRSVETITPEDITHFADILAWWPKGGVNKPCFADKTPEQIAKYVKRNKLPRLMLSTQAKHLFYVDAFFNWLIRASVLTENPLRYVDMGRYQEDRVKKSPFTKQDIKTMFELGRISKLTKPLEYWGPLLALFTALRCNEIAQLLVDNIQAVEMCDEDDVLQTVHCIEVSDAEEGQSVKSASSRRLVPIHSKLIEAGFLEYVEDIRKYGSKELFPGISWSGTGPGHTLSAWFNGEYMRKECGITKKRVTLHCFRHTVNTMADRSRVPPGVMVSINGHADGQSVAEKHYISRADVLECQHYLEKLPFPELELPTYTSERFKPHLDQLKAKKESLERRIKEGVPLPKKRGPKPVEDLFAQGPWKDALGKTEAGVV